MIFAGCYQFIPCNLHFMMYDCEKEWFCNEADEDPKGVNVVHGYSHLFIKGQFWNELYKTFEKVNVTIEFYVYEREIPINVNDVVL